MNEKNIRQLLKSIQNNEISIDEGIVRLKGLPFDDLEFAKIDHHRHLRRGFPEVVYCAGKTNEQVVAIIENLVNKSENNVLATKASREIYEAVAKKIPDAVYYELARSIVVRRGKQEKRGYILVISAGTSDIPVAEEAAITVEVMGNKVERLYDVGVAGIHRLFSQKDKLFAAKVLVVVAGMEGALVSVVAGMVDKPVIAVPTSVGYGTNFGGLSALLTMLNSCASGVGVVNIDNGFGAGYLASLINRLGEVD